MVKPIQLTLQFTNMDAEIAGSGERMVEAVDIAAYKPNMVECHEKLAAAGVLLRS